MTRPFALVTGATDGIGRATAQRLSTRGWDVGVVGRHPARLEATVAELQAAAPDAQVLPFRADLAAMAEVADLARAVADARPRLDLLLLNANTITQTHGRTGDGFEHNLAIGFYGRVLLAWGLEARLRATPGARLVGVVGLNLTRVDLDAPPAPFSSMKALGRWQWAWQVFVRGWNARVPVPAVTWMPGLVRTKILADEPQPMRLLVQVAQRLVGIPVERSAEELVGVVEALGATPAPDAWIRRRKVGPPRALGEVAGDLDAVWAHAARVLAPWREG